MSKISRRWREKQITTLPSLEFLKVSLCVSCQRYRAVGGKSKSQLVIARFKAEASCEPYIKAIQPITSKANHYLSILAKMSYLNVYFSSTIVRQ
jgi:hypothetical protein